MIKQFISIFKGSIKLNYDWKGVPGKAKPAAAPEDGLLVVDEDVDRQEFRSRYGKVRFTAFAAAISFLFSFGSLLFSKNIQDLLFCLAGMSLFLLFYIRYSMVLWISRRCWDKWDKRNNKVIVTGKNFLHVVIKNPQEFLPLALPKGE